MLQVIFTYDLKPMSNTPYHNTSHCALSENLYYGARPYYPLRHVELHLHRHPTLDPLVDHPLQPDDTKYLKRLGTRHRTAPSTTVPTVMIGADLWIEIDWTPIILCIPKRTSGRCSEHETGGRIFFFHRSTFSSKQHAAPQGIMRISVNSPPLRTLS